ncbi:hypothetical protein M885DRAFT_625270 [Pelagophyceae sp. CCMP2097]|nr:hypothetical protein M885DRAFT_625270 [Pelagophyceae sp. CCMP2097]
MSTQTYRDNMNHILRVFMGIKGASSHSIRRAAAQWAGRCGDLGIGCRNAGRWRSWTHFMTYIGQGATKNNEHPPGQDPIFTTWSSPFKNSFGATSFMSCAFTVQLATSSCHVFWACRERMKRYCLARVAHSCVVI